MNKAIVVTLIVLALAAGFVSGTVAASSRQPVVSTNLTAYERGQLMVGCYGIQERLTVSVKEQRLRGAELLGGIAGLSDSPTGALVGSRDACLDAVKALP